MEMHQVRYFLAVCEAQNFTRAAENCNVAQPSLTKAIKKLEEEFGGRRSWVLQRRNRKDSTRRHDNDCTDPNDWVPQSAANRDSRA